MKEGLYDERVDVSRTGTPPAGPADRHTAGGPPPALAASRPWQAFTLLVVTYFITIVDFTIVNVALPTIGRGLGGFTRALVVCGLSGLAAIPVAFALIRRSR